MKQVRDRQVNAGLIIWSQLPADETGEGQVCAGWIVWSQLAADETSEGQVNAGLTGQSSMLMKQARDT